MPASTLVTRRRVLVALAVLVLVVAAVVAVATLRSGADPATDATPSAGTTASAAAGSDADSEASESGADADARSSDDAPVGQEPDADDDADDEKANPDDRETLAPRPFDAAATPQPGVTLKVPSVEKVKGEANLPGEVGGPALRFTVELANDTGKKLDLRTVVVNAYYGPDRTPAAPLLKPGGKAFEAETGVDDAARGVFVFNVPTEFQDEVELEVDPGIGKPVVIFAGA